MSLAAARWIALSMMEIKKSKKCKKSMIFGIYIIMVEPLIIIVVNANIGLINPPPPEGQNSTL